jgi:O-antigen/teichoic acid export membrane protein
MSLRVQVLRGGTYLSLRQGLGMLISSVGIVLLTRTLGPEAYGLYAACLGVYTYLFNLGQLGIGVYLIRREGEVTPGDYHQAFSLLMLLGIGLGILGFLGLPLFASLTRLKGFVPVAAAIFAGLPLNLASLPPLAQLERALNYRKVAAVELGGQLAYYVMALPLAFCGFGIWAAVAGWWCQLLLTTGLVYKISGYRPRWLWDPARLKTMVSYGLGFSASIWIWQLRSLVPPLVVGRYAGAEAVGYVALAIRLVESLGFVKAVTWRVSIAALAKVQDERARLIKAITEGMRLQVLALGLLYLGFVLIGPWLLPILLGERWTPVMQIFPFIALGYLVNALFNLHSSALYVVRRNWEVAFFHLIHIILFVGGALILVPRLGIIGYGLGEVIALLSYPIIHFQVIKYVGKPGYLLAGVWTSAFAISFFWQWAGIAAFLPLLGTLVWPATWRTVKYYWEIIARSLRHE